MALTQTRAMDASRRRFVYGVNALVQAVLAMVLLAGVIWLGGRFKWQTDLTRAGINSLSPSTRQLLQNLDQNIRITAIFPEPDKRDQLGQKRRRQIKDLLDLYDSAGGARLSTYVLDPSVGKAETDPLLARLKALPAYKNEAAPHEEALKKFPPLNEKLSALASNDAKEIVNLVSNDPRLARDRSLAIVVNNLRLVEREATNITEEIDDLKKDEIPRYGQAVQKVRDYLTQVQTLLKDASGWMSGDALKTQGLSGPLLTFFEGAKGRYEPVLAEVAALLDSTKDLKAVKLEEVYNGIVRWRNGNPPVLVEGEKEARILGFWEIWAPPTDPNAPVGPDGDDREFTGESAISSAVLQLTQKDKTAVIFTRFGGESPIRPDYGRMQMMQQMPRAPYQVLDALLKKANFLTEDWDVQQAKTPPEVKDAARRVYVVFPPEPPPRPNPMEPSPQGGMTPEDRKIVLDAVQASGLAVFLTGFAPPPSPFPGAVGTYEYAEYLRSNWGVEVLSNYLTLMMTPNPQKRGWWLPASRQFQLITAPDPVRFTDQPIGKPSRADRAGFYNVCPLRVVDSASRPAGLTVDVVAEVKPTDDVWAVSDLRRLDEQWKLNQGLRRDEGDITPPFPIAVAASKAGSAAAPTTSAPQMQRVVVFGSEQFAADAIAQASGLQDVGNRLVLGPLYPANSDVFINSLHWLTGEANRIALGPRRADLPRLSGLDEKWAGRLPWFLVGIWPALALVAGVGVWLVRRR